MGRVLTLPSGTAHGYDGYEAGCRCRVCLRAKNNDNADRKRFPRRNQMAQVVPIKVAAERKLNECARPYERIYPVERACPDCGLPNGAHAGAPASA